MLHLIYRSIVATVILALILCGVYPLLVTGVAQFVFPNQSSGEIILGQDGKPVGARLIGQAFTKPEYFHGRPSSAGDKGYDAANSSGSNLGPTNQKLYDGLKANIDHVLKENPILKRGEVPTDLVTGSGSGLDPHISPEAARVQVDRVAKARGVSADQVSQVLSQHIEGPQWGIFGESVVNVLMTNLDLDRLIPIKK
jgi:K+-transporting ATPase ATPase C chain